MKNHSLSSKQLNRIMFILSLLGVLVAAYVFQSFVRQSPILCVNSGCELVRKNPASYLFGIPVPGFGLVGYALLVILTFLRSTSDTLHKTLLPIVVAITVGGVVFIGWFTYVELFVIRAICTWCFVSAVIMVTLCILSIRSYTLPRQ